VRRPLWREDGSAIFSVISQWFESRRTRNHTLLSHLRLPQLGGTGSRVYIPQEQDVPVIPLGTGLPSRRLLRLVSDHLQSYGGDIWPSPNLEGQIPVHVKTYIPQELDGQVQNQSHVMTSGQLISMSWSVVHEALEVLHPNEFKSSIRRGYIKTKFYILPLGRLYVKHAVQRGIWVQTQYLLWDQGKPRKILIELAGRRTFGMQTDF
jgi:hypothetical protein